MKPPWSHKGKIMWPEVSLTFSKPIIFGITILFLNGRSWKQRKMLLCTNSVCCFSKVLDSFIVLLINVKSVLLDFRMKIKICYISYKMKSQKLCKVFAFVEDDRSQRALFFRKLDFPAGDVSRYRKNSQNNVTVLTCWGEQLSRT